MFRCFMHIYQCGATKITSFYLVTLYSPPYLERSTIEYLIKLFEVVFPEAVKRCTASTFSEVDQCLPIAQNSSTELDISLTSLEKSHLLAHSRLCSAVLCIYTSVAQPKSLVFIRSLCIHESG
jgi:hypothetical protein